LFYTFAASRENFFVFLAVNFPISDFRFLISDFRFLISDF